MQFSRQKAKGKITLEAKHYRNHLRISLRSSNGNASPKPHNAATIYQRERRRVSLKMNYLFFAYAPKAQRDKLTKPSEEHQR